MSDSDSLPSDIEIAATSAISTLLPRQSKEKYEKTFNIFITWCSEKNIKNICNEKVLLAYFEYLLEKIHLLVSILKEYYCNYSLTILTGRLNFILRRT